MPKYEVRLESTTDPSSRLVTLSAPSEAEARAICVMAEREVVDYTFDGDPYLTDDEAAHIEAFYRIGDNGKVVTVDGSPGDKRYRAKLHQHLQVAPYVVAGIHVVRLDLDRLVRELAGLQHDPDAWKRLLDGLREQGIPFAAVTGGLYGIPMKNQYDGTAVMDWDTDTIKTSLHTAYTFNQDAHDFFDDVSATEITGTGYTAGGATLGTKTATYDTATDQTRLDAADTTWATSTLSATDCVTYKSTGTSSTSPLIGALDFGATVSTTAGTFQITWDSTGLVVLDVT